jgi:ketosteroid isomerase-like protein
MQENIDMVVRALGAYTRRDVEALRTLADPEMVLDWSASRGWLADAYRGVDESLRFYADYFEAFEGSNGGRRPACLRFTPCAP